MSTCGKRKSVPIHYVDREGKPTYNTRKKRTEKQVRFASFLTECDNFNNRVNIDVECDSKLKEGKVMSDSVHNHCYNSDSEEVQISKEFTVTTNPNINTVRGTTSIFVQDKTSTEPSFRELLITSARISVAKHPDLVAVQTLQFQKTSKDLRGHTCMVFQNNTWKLFFVWSASMIHCGYVIGYIYTGNPISPDDITSLSLSKKDKYFCWVNLFKGWFQQRHFKEFTFSVKVIDGYYFGDHTPSQMYLPLPNLQLMSYQKKYSQNAFKIMIKEKGIRTEGLNNLGYDVSSMIGSPDTMIVESSRNKTKRGGGKKLCQIFRTNTTLTLPYMTIFLPSNYEVPYKQFLESSELILAIPYAESARIIENHPFCTVDYALIHQSNVNRLNGLKHHQYNQVLDVVKEFKFSLYQPTNHLPTRFCIMCESEFNTMKEHLKLYCWDQHKSNTTNKDKHCCDLKIVDNIPGHSPFLYGVTNKPNIVLPGVCVSMWRKSNNIQDVSTKVTDAVEECFGRGFGDRSCAPCLGINAYFGNHYNKRVIDRPETEPGTRFLDHYSRQTNKHQELLSICQKFIINQAYNVLQATRTMNHNYMLFVGYDTCNRIIWTQGIDTKGKTQNQPNHRNQPCISFSNKIHVDKCDVVKSEQSEQWFRLLEAKKNEKCKNDTQIEAANHVIKKFKEIESLFGIGLPTTCGYTHVISDENDIVEVNSTFVLMNFSMPITHKQIHHMYAWTFPHATALTTVITSDSRVLVYNGSKQRNYVNIAAWGNCGGNKHAVKRNIN